MARTATSHVSDRMHHRLLARMTAIEAVHDTAEYPLELLEPDIDSAHCGGRAS
jgi:hypothetical protein